MTYKQKYLNDLTKKIQLLDKEYVIALNKHLSNNEILKLKQILVRFREIRRKAESLHGFHFIPKRFRTSEYISLMLTFNNQ